MDGKNTFLNSKHKAKFKPQKIDNLPKKAIEIGIGIITLEAVANLAKKI